VSHTHWDHIQGIPFFAPLFQTGAEWDIYGPTGLSQGLRTTLAGQMDHAYFPIALDQFAARIRYHDLVEGRFEIEDILVTTRYLNHPALTLAYRIEADGGSVVYACDHEPSIAGAFTGDALEGGDQRHVDFVRGADLLIHDAQYTADEYPQKVGWGHSTPDYAIRVCAEAGAKKLVLTHHDPRRDDAAVDRLIESARARAQGIAPALEVIAAAEGLTIDIAGNPQAVADPARAQFEAKTAIDESLASRPVLLHLADNKLTALLSEGVTSERLTSRVVDDREELVRRVLEDQPSLVLIEHHPPRIEGLAIARDIRAAEGEGRVRVPLVLVASETGRAAEGDDVATEWLIAPFSASYARTKIRAWALRSACRWIRAQRPPDEAHRLDALDRLAILDTSPEERFDRVTRLAAAALDVPIALVSLVDKDRQWFKSRFGLDVRETGRDAAFCAHVVHDRQEIVVPDTLLDERFADNPLVVGSPRVRFYAGAPLILDDGSCIGTLCVIDTRPRRLTPGALATLRDLRDVALEEIKRTGGSAR
jgi:ribonuclease BN (tRNA processing enzyme)/DNA-binding response OmpR family regulator